MKDDELKDVYKMEILRDINDIDGNKHTMTFRLKPPSAEDFDFTLLGKSTEIIFAGRLWNLRAIERKEKIKNIFNGCS